MATIRHDIYQGSIGSVSPAIGSYTINTYVNIDRGVTGASYIVGISGMQGVTGNMTLEPWKTDTGVTGINYGDFRNISRGW